AYDPRALPYAQNAMQALVDMYGELQSLDVVGQPYLALHTQSTWFRFWSARDEAYRAIFRDPPPRIVHKTPQQLVEEKVSLRQIAFEWRWLLPAVDGNPPEPDVERVQRELDKSGSECTPEAIEALHQDDLKRQGFVYVEPPSPAVEELRDELAS